MIKEIQKLELKENDILVMTFDVMEFDVDEIREIYQRIQDFIPNNKVLAIPQGIELSTISIEQIENKSSYTTWKVN